MEADDFAPREVPPLDGLEKEDLGALSIDELKERIARLRVEIQRAESAIDAKQNTKGAAEALFKK